MNFFSIFKNYFAIKKEKISNSHTIKSLVSAENSCGKIKKRKYYQ